MPIPLARTAFYVRISGSPIRVQHIPQFSVLINGGANEGNDFTMVRFFVKVDSSLI
jgi:hypothetical protein